MHFDGFIGAATPMTLSGRFSRSSSASSAPKLLNSSASRCRIRLLERLLLFSIDMDETWFFVAPDSLEDDNVEETDDFAWIDVLLLLLPE